MTVMTDTRKLLGLGSEPAAPCHEAHLGSASSGRQHLGLTKRELLAAMAMQGVLAADVESNISAENAAKFAVRQADALLEELAK